MLRLKYLFEKVSLAKECIELYEYNKETLDDMMSFFRISSNAIYPFRAGENAEKICFLRLSPAEEKSFEDVVTEVELINWLIENGFPAMRPVSMKDGEFAKQMHTEWGVYNVSCFEKVPGESLENVNGTLEIAKGYGYTLGNLHALLKEYPHSENRRDHRALLDEISCRIQKYDAPETVKRELLAVSKEIEQLPVLASDYGIVHYDFEPDNVFYDAETDSFSVIDFDDAICCWYALDIVRALDGLDEVVKDSDMDEAKFYFMEGYKSATDLTEEQQQTFALMRRLVRLQEYAALLHVMSEPILEMPEWMIGLTDKLKCKLHWLENMMELGKFE